MSPSSQPELLEPFFVALREKGFHLGLDPEFSAIQKLALAPPEQQFPTLREHIDQFFWARGFPVLEKLQQKAAEEKNLQAERVLGSMHSVIHDLLRGQFVLVPDNQQLPQPGMLREMLRLFNTYDADAVIAYIDKNIEFLDGHFFMSLSESLRNARGRDQGPAIQATIQVLTMLGKMVAQKESSAGCPAPLECCSCHDGSGDPAGA